MTPASSRDRISEQQGKRAQEVATWYFRLNGFLHIPEYVLHSDQQGRAVTDADLLGVRFPYSHVSIRDITMVDDRWVSEVTYPGQTLIVIAEVKTGKCHVNGPWTDPKREGMEKVVRRIGFVKEEMIPEITKKLYDTLHWYNDDFRVQYVAVGERTNHELTRRYRALKQLTWADIAHFLFERFHSFGTVKGIHDQWPRFGREFARAVERCGVTHAQQAAEFIETYISEGHQGRRR
ncbi:MAG: hypothetical protein ABGZ53_12445 [Fuerstiella sp.]